MKNLVKALMAVAAAALLATGCAKSNNGAEIKIGGIFPLSGPVSVYGLECRRGIELAISEINSNGGVNGKQFKLLSEDDEGNESKSVSAYKKLTVQDNVDYIIGSLTSGCTKAVTELAQADGIIQFAPAATRTDITDAGNNIFRACYTDPFQGQVGGKFAVENLGAKNAAILYDAGNDYSVGLTENFIKAFTAGNGTIIAKESYMTKDIDFNSQITKIKSANPDVIYLPDYYGTVALIAKQLRAQGVNTTIVGADGWDGLCTDAGDEVIGGFYSNHYAADSDKEIVKNFVANFTKMYKSTPNSFAALGYDCVYLLKDAIIAAEENGEKATTDTVRAALESISGSYVTGELSFDEHHNPVKSAVMVEIVKKDNALTTVYKTTVNP